MKNKYITIILFIMSIILIITGTTLSTITKEQLSTNVSISSGDLIMDIDIESGEDEIFFPTTCTGSGVIKRKIVATTTNTSGGRVSFTIGLIPTVLGDDLKRNTIKWALATGDSCEEGLLSSGNFANKNVKEEFYLIQNDYEDITYNSTNNTYTKTYYLYIWLDYAEVGNIDGELLVSITGNTSNDPELETIVTTDIS